MSITFFSSLDGVFGVWKPSGPSSAKIVETIKHEICSSIRDPKEKRHIFKSLKVGHGGTLDPLAEGVLVIGIGKGCKKLGGYLHGSKKYIATAVFGKHYDTLDISGKLLFEDSSIKPVIFEQLESICSKWIGEITQIPPAFSAVHINGRRAYEIARELRNSTSSLSNSDKLSLSPRKVVVHSIQILDINFPEVTFEFHVGGGTYIRSLIHDIARELETYASLKSLIRVKQGIFESRSCKDSELVLSPSDCRDLNQLSKILKTTKELI